ncbi:MAG: cryptochrome/photolyase family protein [Solirubrobacterales bacterium]
MKTIIVLYTRDLRVNDHPALDAARTDGDRVVPAFVFDDDLLDRFGVPNRIAFLLDCLHDLRDSLRDRDADLVVRRGDWVREVMGLVSEASAAAVYMSADVSAMAHRRERTLGDACREQGVEFQTFPGVTIVEPGEVEPTGGGHYKVYSPYRRAWQQVDWRDKVPTPRSLEMLTTVPIGEIPDRSELATGEVSPQLIRGGETLGRERMFRWLRDHLASYDDNHDDLAGDKTSRLSAYLHFGCVSPLEAALEARDRVGGEPFVAQLAWRDFHHQVVDAFPAMAREEYRTQGDDWRDDDEHLERWKQGRTGYPIVDAGMRQLLAEGWMHNRARMIVASFLTKDLYIDWRHGCEHFFDWLVDGDIANNAGNWQWTAGTGNDTRPNRMFNPLRQAERFDAGGTYVRRWVPELESIEGGAVHEPWKLADHVLDGLDYPEPLVDHDEAREAFKRRRA